MISFPFSFPFSISLFYFCSIFCFSIWPFSEAGIKVCNCFIGSFYINFVNTIVHFCLHRTVHFMEKVVSACLWAGSASAERVGQGRWVEGVLHIVATRLGCKSVMVGTEWATSCAGWKDRRRKCYCHYRENCLGSGRVLDNREYWLLHTC